MAAGSSGTRPNATILQPVPMGNPMSNSDQYPALPLSDPNLVPSIKQPAVSPSPAAPVKP
jgi:hypothetical protein